MYPLYYESSMELAVDAACCALKELVQGVLNPQGCEFYCHGVISLVTPGVNDTASVIDDLTNFR